MPLGTPLINMLTLSLISRKDGEELAIVEAPSVTVAGVEGRTSLAANTSDELPTESSPRPRCQHPSIDRISYGGGAEQQRGGGAREGEATSLRPLPACASSSAFCGDDKKHGDRTPVTGALPEPNAKRERYVYYGNRESNSEEGINWKM
uniref:Uncharacterized protein n=1 Tax=Oryza glumipatula TaxID=40148 RepID=A0A0D9YRX3_9ORYZ